jgi:PAS domain S-box-containing protein
MMMPFDIEPTRQSSERAPAMSWRTGLAPGRSDCCAAWLTFTGRSLEQELGNGWTEGVHPDDRAACLALFLDRFERRQPFVMQYRLRRSDGTYRYVLDHGVARTADDGTFAGFVGRCLEADEHDFGTREERSGTADFFGMSLDNLCVAGFDGYFKRVNPSWTRTLGWTAKELMSKPSLEFVHPDDRATTTAGRQLLAAGSPLGGLTNRYLCKDGSYRWFEWSSVSDGDRGLVYAAARDVTEQRLAEERLREANERQEKLQRQLFFADRMASVGTLAAGVAHEINNPLSYVAGNVTMIREQLARPGGVAATQLAELEAMAADAHAGAERIRKIVLGLKAFSRAEEERRAVIDVKPVLELSIDMAFNEIRHRARLVKDYGALPLVDVDEARLGQVFINLLVNAAQALPEGQSAANEIRVVTSTDPAGRAVIEIHDTGRGIPAALLERVFDPFFTTKPVGIGTGLGLSICHTMVTRMGGEISVKSEQGRGTTFRVALPAASLAQAEPAPPEAAPQPAPTRATVLVVDDEEAVGSVLRRVLRDHDVTVVTAAKAALALLDSGAHFDLILSDLMMPEMSGMEFYEQLRLRFPHAVERVIFVSGGAFTPHAHAFLDRVSNQRIEKPFDPKNVRGIVQRFIDR